MPERHVFLSITVLLPVLLSLAQAHCGTAGLLFTGGCLVAGSAAWFWRRRHLQQAMAAQQQALSDALVLLQRQLADQQRECRALRAAQVQTEQARQAWFVTISQELRTPLNTVIGYSELFQETAPQMVGQELSVDVQMLHEAGQQLRALLGDMHDLAQIEAGTVAFCHETFDIIGMVEEVLADLQPCLQERGHTCELLLPTVPGSMQADRPKVRRCLDNLLRQMARLSRQRRLVVQVACEATPVEERLVIRLYASALGTQGAPLNAVATPAVPVGAAMLQRYGGTGLGLLLSQRLCQLMGGELILTGAGDEDIVGLLHLPRWTPGPTDSPVQAPGSTPSELPTGETYGLTGAPEASPLQDRDYYASTPQPTQLSWR